MPHSSCNPSHHPSQRPTCAGLFACIEYRLRWRMSLSSPPPRCRGGGVALVGGRASIQGGVGKGASGAGIGGCSGPRLDFACPVTDHDHRGRTGQGRAGTRTRSPVVNDQEHARGDGGIDGRIRRVSPQLSMIRPLSSASEAADSDVTATGVWPAAVMAAARAAVQHGPSELAYLGIVFEHAQEGVGRGDAVAGVPPPRQRLGTFDLPVFNWIFG